MSKKKLEGELSDILSLNEEMQSIWSEKESEVRQMLERFSTYRDAVEADSNEKDEMYAEELNKREVLVKELEFVKNELGDQLSKKDTAIELMITDLEIMEAARMKEFIEIHELLIDLAKRYTETETGAKDACEAISARLKSVIAGFKEQDFTKYTSHLDVNGVDGQETGPDVVKTDHNLNDCTSVEHSISCIQEERLVEEDLLKLVKRMEMEERGIDCAKNTSYDEDGLVEAYVERKAVVRLLEEQWTRHQLQCKEKEDEMQHWKRKHKQDTKNLQEHLEDQERSELKNREVAAELRVEIEKLRRKVKTLETDIEIAKEQSEDDACALRENFEKDLSAQLRRQNKSLLSVEEASRAQLAELEESNEKLHRSNDDLRRQIGDHCSEIKSWVTGVLMLTEEEYNEEFRTITDVLTKLQEIIVGDKRTIAELRDQIAECEDDRGGSPEEGLLSRSWGGHSSCNSSDAQKELCWNCRQTKWRRVLMGSFDFVEAATDVKQDEVEKYVAKINLDEPRYRKKKSLKDSLEMAEAHTELIERLGEDNWDSLGTLNEDSMEAKGIPCGSIPNGFQDISSEANGKEDGRSSSEDSGSRMLLEDENKAVCELQVGRVDSGIVDEDSARSSPDEVDGFRREGSQNRRDGGGKWKGELGDGDGMGEDDERERASGGDVIMEWATQQGLVIQVEDYDEMIGEEKDVDDLVDDGYRDHDDNNHDYVDKDVDGDDVYNDDGDDDVNDHIVDGDDYNDDGDDYNDGDDDVNDHIVDGDDVYNDDGDDDVNDRIVDGDDDYNDDEDDVNDHMVDGDNDHGDCDGDDHGDYRDHVNNNDGGNDHNHCYVDNKNVDGDGYSRNNNHVHVNNSYDDDDDDDDVNYDDDEDDEDDEDDDDENDDNEDLVRVVNLYRSLVVNDFNDLSTTRDSSSSDRNHQNQKKKSISLTDNIIEKPVPHGAMDSLHNQDVQERRIPRNDNASWHSEIFNDKNHGNLPEANINDEMKSNLTRTACETSSDRKSPKREISSDLVEEDGLKQVGTENTKISTSELRFSGMLQPELSESLKNVNSERVEISGCAQERKVSTEACSHCSRISTQSKASYEKAIERLLELKTQQAKDHELEMARELDAARAEARQFQRQYEDLEKVREDYMSRTQEYSEKMKRNSAELRKLKLNSNVMKTEVEWLRQALGITRDYSELRKNF